MIDKWVSEGSGWAIDRIDSHYLNVTLYEPLNGSSYIELPLELRNSKKGLINIKNQAMNVLGGVTLEWSTLSTNIQRELRKRTKK